VAEAPRAALPDAVAPRARDRASTEDRILAAVGAVLAREGFAGLGVNAVAREAGVDKVLIYRYFGGLPELLRAWGQSGRFWPRLQDLLGDEPAALLALPAAERYARFFDHFIDELRRRLLTLEILAAEMQQPNPLTDILDAEREAWGADASRVLGGSDFAQAPCLNAVTLLLVMGVQVLLVRTRHTPVFSGIDLHSEAGWAQIKASIAEVARRLLPPPPPAGSDAGQ